MNKHLIWIIGLIIIISIICGTLIYLNNHPYKFKIEMDDNTLEAIKSINFSEIQPNKEYFCDCGIYYPCLDYNWSKYNWTYYPAHKIDTSWVVLK